MDLSIVVCTYNRYELLARNLEKACALEYPARHQLIVVDNSDDADGTRRFLADAATRFPGVKIIRSSPPGLARARNAGLRAATGEFVAFLDDDAIVETGWDEALIETFKRTGAICVGGPIAPIWETAPPGWLPRSFYGALTILDLGQEERDLGADEYLYGANIAFSRRALLECGGFDEQFGRVRQNLASEEDLEVQTRLNSRGRRMYSPHARVSHFIPAERCTLGWLTRRYAWQGLSEATRGNIDMHAHHAALLEDAREHPIYRDLLDELAREPADDRQAGQRLQFIRGLSAALLGCNGLLSTANSSLQQPAPNLKPAPHGASRLATWFSGRF